MCNLKKDVVKAEKLYLLRKYFNSVKLRLFHFLKFKLHQTSFKVRLLLYYVVLINLE